MKKNYEFEFVKSIRNTLILIVLIFLSNIYMLIFTNYNMINLPVFYIVVLFILMNSKIIRHMELYNSQLKVSYFRFFCKKSSTFHIQDLTFKIEKFGSLREKPQDYLNIYHNGTKLFKIGKNLFEFEDDLSKLYNDLNIIKNGQLPPTSASMEH